MAFLDRVVELRRVRAAELLPDPRNWRRHPESQREALEALLTEVGMADALLARQTGQGLVLVDGHLRRELDPEAVLPVLVLDVTEAEAATLLATLDPLAGMAVADPGALAALLAEAVVPDEHLETALWQVAGDVAFPGRTDPEAIPERPAPRVRPGELWAMGPHRLLCADSTRPESLDRLMGADRAHVLWTDPPYGVGYTGKTPEALTISGDERQGLEALLQRALAAADAKLRPGARIYLCHPTGPGAWAFHRAFTDRGWRLHQSLVWVKDRMVLGHSDYHHRHEGILYGYKPGPGRWGRGGRGWYGGNDQDSVLEVPRPAASREHPTAKPVELVRTCLANSSRPGDAVLDPFAGSGSVLIACQELGRRCFGVEIDPGYCDVILERWEAFTGEIPRRVDG